MQYLSVDCNPAVRDVHGDFGLVPKTVTPLARRSATGGS